jgi:hypothetical protein
MMLAALVTALLTISGLGAVAPPVQSERVMVAIDVDGKEQLRFEPRSEPYTQGGPRVAFPVRDGQARTKEGLSISSFEFIGWSEGDGYRVFAFVAVPPTTGSGADRRIDFGSVHLARGETVSFDKMKEVGMKPWTIRVRGKD